MREILHFFSQMDERDSAYCNAEMNREYMYSEDDPPVEKWMSSIFL